MAHSKAPDAAAVESQRENERAFLFIIQGIPEGRQPVRATLPTVETILPVFSRKRAGDCWIFAKIERILPPIRAQSRRSRLLVD
jgi:hypothetical protein